MFLIIVLATVGCVSVVVARSIQQGIGHRQLIATNHGAMSPSQRKARATLVMVFLTAAIFLPLLLVAYVAIGLVRHAIGQ
jgi:phosphatidylglycerophosphate synthase